MRHVRQTEQQGVQFRAHLVAPVIHSGNGVLQFRRFAACLFRLLLLSRLHQLPDGFGGAVHFRLFRLRLLLERAAQVVEFYDFLHCLACVEVLHCQAFYDGLLVLLYEFEIQHIGYVFVSRKYKKKTPVFMQNTGVEYFMIFFSLFCNSFH